jgi:hypothetical protein
MEGLNLKTTLQEVLFGGKRQGCIDPASVKLYSLEFSTFLLLP